MRTEWFNIELCDVHDTKSTGTAMLTMVTGTQKYTIRPMWGFLMANTDIRWLADDQHIA